MDPYDKVLKLIDDFQDLRKADVDKSILIRVTYRLKKAIKELQKHQKAKAEFRMRPTQACYDGDISEKDWTDMNKS